MCGRSGSLPSPPLVRPVLLLPSALPSRIKEARGLRRPRVYPATQPASVPARLLITLTHTLFGEWESTEGNLGELLGAGSRLYPPGHLAAVPQFWHAGRAAARAPAAVRGELPGPRPTARKEGNKNTKKLHRAKPEAPASFRQGTRRCRAPTL